jgi:hypothetical protein
MERQIKISFWDMWDDPPMEHHVECYVSGIPPEAKMIELIKQNSPAFQKSPNSRIKVISHIFLN